MSRRTRGFQFDLTSKVIKVDGNVLQDASSGEISSTVSRVTASGNVTANQLISTVSNGTPPLVVSSSTMVNNLYAATALKAGTVTTAAQPNITSVGTLTSLTTSGTTTAGNLSTSGTLSVTGNGTLGNLSTTTATVTTGNIGTINATNTNSSNLTISTLANITSATASTSTTTGALKVAGGVGIVGNLYTGGQIQASGLISAGYVTATYATFTGTEAITLPKGTTAQRPASPVQGSFRYNTEANGFEVYNGTSWGSIAGGGGNAGGSTGEVQFNNGGVFGGVDELTYDGTAVTAGNLIVSSYANITATTASTSTTSGALKVAGGAGIAGNLYVGGNENISGALSVTGTITGNVTGTLTGNATGNAGTATKLATARSIALTGDVSGSANFDGSANISITATVADDSHNHIISNVDGLQAALDLKAALASPALTGTPTAPTASTGTNTTQIATTEFVNAEIASEAPTKTGGGASGTWPISISGNADTVDGFHESTFMRRTATSDLAMANYNITGVNNIQIGDPGPGEGIEWLAGNLWKIYESPNDLSTNSGGNLQIVQNSTRRATFNTSGQLEIPVATGTAPLAVSSTTRVSNLSVANAGTADSLTTSRTISLTGDVSGSASFNGSANASITATVADNSHNHTWSNITSVPGQLVTSTASLGSTAAGWYTIAANSGNRASAKFAIADQSSGLHQTLHFYASHHYGSGNDITVVHNDSYSGGGPFRYLRIKEGSTYDGAMLQIYLDSASSGWQVYMYENINSAGWVLVNAVPDGTNPGTVSSFAALTTVAAQVDLDAGTMATTGNMTAVNFLGTASSAKYADLAEKYIADAEYAPGTVLVFGGDAEVTISTSAHDSSVAGVVSTDPAYLMNSDAEGVELALTGRVPCKVLGPVKKGTVLVTSDVPGTAMAIDNTKYVPGCVIGKSMGVLADGEIGIIEIAVGRF